MRTRRGICRGQDAEVDILHMVCVIMVTLWVICITCCMGIWMDGYTESLVTISSAWRKVETLVLVREATLA